MSDTVTFHYFKPAKIAQLGMRWLSSFNLENSPLSNFIAMVNRTAKCNQNILSSRISCQGSVSQALMKSIEGIDLLNKARSESNHTSCLACFPVKTVKLAGKYDWKICFRRLRGLPTMIKARQGRTWCIVCLQVHHIRNLPLSMSADSVKVSWRRADGRGEETLPVKVIDGIADFDEIFLPYFEVPCNLKNFRIMVSSLDTANESELGNFDIELNELVVQTCSDLGVKTKRFNLLGRGAGGILEISFYYRACPSVLHDPKLDRCLSGPRQERGCFNRLHGFMRGKNHQVARVSTHDESDFNFITIPNSKEFRYVSDDEAEFTTMETSLDRLDTLAAKSETDDRLELETMAFKEDKVNKEKITSLTNDEESEADLVENEFLNLLEMDDDLDFDSIIREAELEIMKAAQICRKQAIDIEKDEYAELMKRWGLDEDTFQVNPSLGKFDGFGSPICL